LSVTSLARRRYVAIAKRFRANGTRPKSPTAQIPKHRYYPSDGKLRFGSRFSVAASVFFTIFFTKIVVGRPYPPPRKQARSRSRQNTVLPICICRAPLRRWPIIPSFIPPVTPPAAVCSVSTPRVLYQNIIKRRRRGRIT